MSKPSKHVVPSSDGSWAVRQSGAERASRVFDRKEDAVTYARKEAKKGRGELYIHGKDGTIRERNSYARDPTPTSRKR
jgi:hypothetical protein